MSRRTLQQWRKAVLQDRLLRDSTRVLLLHVADNHMRPDRKFSVPRAQLAEELNRAERRIDERIADAIAKEFLILLAPGYLKHTAEYQGCWPDPVCATDSSAHTGESDTPMSDGNPHSSEMAKPVAHSPRECATPVGRTTTTAEPPSHERSATEAATTRAPALTAVKFTPAGTEELR